MEDNKVLELLVQAVKNIDEKLDNMKDDMNTRFDEVNKRIDDLQTDMNTRFEAVNRRFEKIDRRFDETNREIRNIKSREKHILDIAMNG